MDLYMAANGRARGGSPGTAKERERNGGGQKKEKTFHHTRMARGAADRGGRRLSIHVPVRHIRIRIPITPQAARPASKTMPSNAEDPVVFYFPQTEPCHESRFPPRSHHVPTSAIFAESERR